MKTVLTLLLGTTVLTARLSAGVLETLHNFGTPLGMTGVEPVASLIAGPDGTFYGTASEGGPGNLGVVYSIATNGYVKTVKNFTNDVDGVFPVSALVLSGNTLYGTTEGYGNSDSYGTVFSIDTDGSHFATLYSFTNGADGSAPWGGLVLSGGVLYGAADTGGTAGAGTIFKINTNGSSFAVLKSFSALDPNTYTNTDGEFPDGTLVVCGSKLYGTASGGGDFARGTVFALETNGGGFQTLHSFDMTNGSAPLTGLTLEGGTLFGTTYEGGAKNQGAIFSLNTDGSGFTNLYSLADAGLDGIDPRCSLTLIGSHLFGTAALGGENDNGTVFSVSTNGTGFKVLYSFSALDPDYYDNDDGANPVGGLLAYQGALYGVTSGGGPVPYFSYGTIFQINPDGSGFSVDYAFDATTTVNDGTYPESALTLGGHTLYGVTPYGGAIGYGVIFKVNTDGTAFSDLHSFSGGDGWNPNDPLLLVGNTLYGTSSTGGTRYDGTIFSIQTDGTGFTNLYSFTNGNDGGGPLAGLVAGNDMLYGTTSYGGSNNLGAIYAIGTNGSGFTVLHPLAQSNGYASQASLLLAGGTLYGEAYFGASSGTGSIFKMQTNGTGFTLLRAFSLYTGVGVNGEGRNPTGGLVLSGDILYGTTYDGGENYAGNVFRMDTNGDGYATLMNFDALPSSGLMTNATGANPEGGVFLAGGKLYGTTPYGGYWAKGALFEVNTNVSGANGFNNLYSFTGNSDGGYPFGGGVVAGGSILGVAYSGGSYDYGTVFGFSILPPLQMTQTGQALVIGWQDDGQNHTLQTTANLAGGPWASAPSLNWTNYPYIGLQLTNQPTLPSVFFRLQQ